MINIGMTGRIANGESLHSRERMKSHKLHNLRFETALTSLIFWLTM